MKSFHNLIRSELKGITVSFVNLISRKKKFSECQRTQMKIRTSKEVRFESAIQRGQLHEKFKRISRKNCPKRLTIKGSWIQRISKKTRSVLQCRCKGTISRNFSKQCQTTLVRIVSKGIWFHEKITKILKSSKRDTVNQRVDVFTKNSV